MELKTKVDKIFDVIPAFSVKPPLETNLQCCFKYKNNVIRADFRF